MNTLDIAIACGVQPRKVASTKGGEYASACPVCGGRDRFRVWPEKGKDGNWFCRRCSKGGDAIALLQHAKGMSFKEACDYIGRQAPAMKRNRTPRAPKPPVQDFIPREIADPAERWQAKAMAFMAYAHNELLKAPDKLAWLAARGITTETARRFSLGWNPARFFRKRSAWGLQEELTAEGKKREWLFMPAGLVIPYVVKNHIVRLRIRRPEPDIDQRYYVVPGSAMPAMKIAPSAEKKGRAWIIVESELDAILIAQDAGDIAGAAALGSVSVKPDGALYAELKTSASILVALDADAAGAKSWPWWQMHFAQADRWPVPSGKDPGDYHKGGGDIRAWVLAGLPPGLRPAPHNLTNAPSAGASLNMPAPSPAPRWAVIDSKVLGEQIILLKEASALADATKAHPGLAAYAPKEIAEIKRLAGQDDRLRLAHLAKKTLCGVIISAKRV